MADGTDWHSRIAAYFGAIAGVLGLVIALFAYCHDVSESEAKRETNVFIEARMNWNGAYFSGVKVDTVPRLHDDGTYGFLHQYFGITFYVDANIYNASEHAISVARVFALHVVDSFLTSGTISYSGYENDLVSPIEFPIFLQPDQQTKVAIRVDWPVCEKVARIYSDWEHEKLYDWRTIVDAYQEASEEPFYGSVGGGLPSEFLGLLAKYRFNTKENQESKSEHTIKVCVKLASGEVYWDQVKSL